MICGRWAMSSRRRVIWSLYRTHRINPHGARHSWPRVPKLSLRNGTSLDQAIESAARDAAGFAGVLLLMPEGPEAPYLPVRALQAMLKSVMADAAAALDSHAGSAGCRVKQAGNCSRSITPPPGVHAA